MRRTTTYQSFVTASHFVLTCPNWGAPRPAMVTPSHTHVITRPHARYLNQTVQKLHSPCKFYMQIKSFVLSELRAKSAKSFVCLVNFYRVKMHTLVCFQRFAVWHDACTMVRRLAHERLGQPRRAVRQANVTRSEATRWIRLAGEDMAHTLPRSCVVQPTVLCQVRR